MGSGEAHQGLLARHFDRMASGTSRAMNTGTAMKQFRMSNILPVFTRST